MYFFAFFLIELSSLINWTVVAIRFDDDEEPLVIFFRFVLWDNDEISKLVVVEFFNLNRDNGRIINFSILLFLLKIIFFYLYYETMMK